MAMCPCVCFPPPFNFLLDSKVMETFGQREYSLKGHRSWISSGSIVDENSVPAILTENLDWQSISFWMKLNKH